MSRLAKFKAKGSDISKEEWERIIKERRRIIFFPIDLIDLVELVLKIKMEVMVNENYRVKE